MARIPKPSGRASSGPWSWRDFLAVLRRAGWKVESDLEHMHLVHPDRPGRKVQLDKKWTSVKVGHDPFKGIAETSGYGTRTLKRMMNAR